MVTIEELYSDFLIREYGPRFFQYTLILNMSVVIFLFSIIAILMSTSKI